MNLTSLQVLLPDHMVRPAAMSDVPELHALVERVNMATLGRVDTSEAELRDDLTGPHFDMSLDTVVAVNPHSQVVAYGQGHDEHTGTGWIDIYLDPAFDDATFDSLADALIAACAARIQESAQTRGAAVVKLLANLYEVEVQMRKAYERNGFHVETVYWRMVLTFQPEDELESPAVPHGYEIRRVDPDDDLVMQQGFELYQDTFSEHHGFEDADMSLELFAQGWRSAGSYDREAWWFAYEGDQPVGMLMGDNRRLEQGEGFVRNLGVRKPLRGKGIARALLLTAITHWRELGRSGVQLGVDTANVTGATRLYESVGMRSLLSAIALERTLRV
ncbi:MAG: GNAT family N-acetyltransferase [Actinomycetes bacterium]